MTATNPVSSTILNSFKTFECNDITILDSHIEDKDTDFYLSSLILQVVSFIQGNHIKALISVSTLLYTTKSFEELTLL